MLLGVDATDVRLQVDDSVIDLPRVALQRAWNGEYIAIWRQAPDAMEPATASDLREFQASHGILADGVIGPETRFALSTSAVGPHLLKDLR